MVRSIDPRPETLRSTQWPYYSEVAALFGTRVAETILASVHVRAHQKAGHMNASDPTVTLQTILQTGGRPHMGRLRPFRSAEARTAGLGGKRA
jgi:hypothetical protein